MAIMPQSRMGTGTYADSPSDGQAAAPADQGVLGSLTDSIFSFRRGALDPQARQRIALGLLVNVGKDPSAVMQQLIMQELMYQMLLKQSQQQPGGGQQGGGLMSMLGMGGGGGMFGGGGGAASSGGGGMTPPNMTSASNYGTLF